MICLNISQADSVIHEAFKLPQLARQRCPLVFSLYITHVKVLLIVNSNSLWSDNISHTKKVNLALKIALG